MPGPYPGRVVRVKSEKCVDTETSAANDAVVREMMARGMCALTGKATAARGLARVRRPRGRGRDQGELRRPSLVRLRLRDRGRDRAPARGGRRPADAGLRLRAVPEPARRRATTRPTCPAGVTIVAAETANRRADNRGYDPATYVEADLFGEEDTRSNMMRLVSEKLTKIINVPNMKDHGATGATGCLKNIAYGSFSNVARTHYNGKSHTYSFVGTLASVEPLRSRTVLQIMDGLRGVWHAGPFARTRKYVFYPKQILFGTDPVAIDRLLLDIIDDKRKADGRHLDLRPRPAVPQDGRRRARATRIPTSTSSSASPATWSSRPAWASGSRTRRRSRSRTSWCDPPPLAGRAAVPLLDARAGDRALAQGRRHRAGLRAARAGRRWRKEGFSASPLEPRRSSSCARRCPCPGSARGPIAPPPRAAPGSTPTAGGSCASRPASTPTRCRRARRPWPRPRPTSTGRTRVLRIDPADVASLGRMMSFLSQRPPGDLPDVADLAVVDDGSAARRRGDEPPRPAEPAVPDREGARPEASRSTSSSGRRSTRSAEAADPSAFALKVRRQLTDDERGRSASSAARSSSGGSPATGRGRACTSSTTAGGTSRASASACAGPIRRARPSWPAPGRLALEERGVVDGGHGIHGSAAGRLRRRRPARGEVIRARPRVAHAHHLPRVSFVGQEEDRLPYRGSRRGTPGCRSTPWTKNALSSASPAVPVGASTATLSTPCTGRPRRGSMMCE